MRPSQHKIWFAGFLSFVGLSMMGLHAAPAGSVVGWMEINPTDGQLQITGRAYSQQPAKIEYVLQIQRSGPSGNTTSKQAGRADIQAGKVATLSTTSITMQSQEQLAVLLTISSGGEVLSTSGIQVGDSVR